MKNSKPILVSWIVLLSLLFTFGCARPCPKCAKKKKGKGEGIAKRDKGLKDDDDEVVENDPIKRQLDELQRQLDLQRQLQNSGLAQAPGVVPGGVNPIFGVDNGGIANPPGNASANGFTPPENGGEKLAIRPPSSLEPAPIKRLQALVESTTHTGGESENPTERRTLE